MAAVIKAAASGRLPAAAFNYEDIAHHASERLQQAQAEAAALLYAARQEAEALRQAALREGRQAAEAQWEEKLRAAVAEQLAGLTPALAQLAAELRAARETAIAHWERNGVKLAAAMAARALRREAAANPQVALPLVREAVELAAGSPQLRVCLHPADHAALRPHIGALLSELGKAGQAQVLADPAVTRGGCRVETSFGAVDQQFESQLARIQEELI